MTGRGRHRTEPEATGDRGGDGVLLVPARGGFPGETMLRSALGRRPWRLVETTDPASAMARLCLARLAVRERSAWGLAAGRDLVAVVATPDEQAAAELLRAIDRHLPECRRWRATVDGGLVDVTPAPDGAARGDTTSGRASSAETADSADSCAPRVASAASESQTLPRSPDPHAPPRLRLAGTADAAPLPETEAADPPAPPAAPGPPPEDSRTVRPADATDGSAATPGGEFGDAPPTREGHRERDDDDAGADGSDPAAPDDAHDTDDADEVRITAEELAMLFDPVDRRDDDARRPGDRPG